MKSIARRVLSNRGLVCNTTKPALSGGMRLFRSDLMGTNMDERWNVHHDHFYEGRVKEYTHPKKPVVTVAVTGAAGQIGYSLLFRLASGEMLGPDQPIIINAIELPVAMDALKGVVMELQDCAFPLLTDVVSTDNPDRGFENVDYALLVGSKPRGPGQERKDVLHENAAIFRNIGKVLNKQAKNSVKVMVVGNPANTNCLITAHNAPDIPVENFSSMMRLDHDRGIAQAAAKVGMPVTDITEFCVWGNHSSTQFPDLSFARAAGNYYREVFGTVEFSQWNNEVFIPTVQQRGGAIINARGHSSAASAANACIAQTRDWVCGNDGRWISMGVCSEGQYDVPKGLWCGFPIEVADSEYSIVEGLTLDAYQEEKIKASVKELMEERDAVASMLG